MGLRPTLRYFRKGSFRNLGSSGNPFYSTPETRRESAEASAILGTPDECVERLRRLRERGVEQVLLAGASIEELRLFAEEVMPTLR